MMDVADILEKAADLLTPEGAWIQGSLNRFRDGKPVCWCALGALIEVGHPRAWEAVERVEAGLPAKPGAGLRPLSAWNDAPERTQAEVVGKFREEAALARQQDVM